MKRIAIFGAAAVMFCIGPSIRANQEPSLPVTPDTIGGLWEGLSTRDTRVFRLELEGARGWLSIAIPFIDPMTFLLTDIRWSEGGVELHFRGVGRSSHGAGGWDDPTPYTALLRLHGVASKVPEAHYESGVLTGEFVLSPDLPNPSRWKLRFVKESSPYLDTVCKLSAQAKEAIEQQKNAPK